MLREERKEQPGEGQVANAEIGHIDSAGARLPELSAEGQTTGAEEGRRVGADGGQAELHGDGGHKRGATKGHAYRAPAAMHPQGDEPGHQHCADKGPADLAALAPTIAAIRYHHRTRVFAMEQRKRADLSLGAFLRTALGWSKSLPDAERKRIADDARGLIELGEIEAKGNPYVVDEPAFGEAYQEWREVILAAIAVRAPFDRIEKAATKSMERLAGTLPVWAAFGDGVPGFSTRGLAVIVGEAGDLSAYPKKGHLWKRMGVAVIGDGAGDGDIRQGGLRKGASAEDWITHGYSAMRRSRMFVIGESLIKTDGPYRAIYLARLAVEHGKAIAEGLAPATTIKATVESWAKRGLPPLALVKKLDAAHRGAGHLDNRAQRYMEKRLLRDLWQAWRRANGLVPGTAVELLPTA